jgi:hypothetical protein
MNGLPYTSEQIDWLRNNRSKFINPGLADEFNRVFNDKRSPGALRNICIKNGILSEKTGYVKGQIPWNKGKKGVSVSPATQFKKGNTPKNTQPVGTECCHDGYIYVKISEPNQWLQKNWLVWEEAHGPVPKGQVVIFVDGDARNFAIDNLKLISRAELLQLNRNKYGQVPKLLKPSVLAMSRLQSAVYQLS